MKKHRIYGIGILSFVSGILLCGCAATKELENKNAVLEQEITVLRENSRTANVREIRLAAENEALKRENGRMKQQLADSIGIVDLFQYNLENNQINSILVQRYLDRIAMPEKPTREQIRAYLKGIMNLKNLYYNSDKVRARIGMDLVGIGREHMDLLFPCLEFQPVQEAVSQLARPSDKPVFLQMLDDRNSRNRYAALNLYRRFADASDKNDILLRLETNSELISLVTRLGFEKEALPILLRMLDQNPNYFSSIMPILVRHLPEKECLPFFERYWNLVRMESSMNRDPYRPINAAMELLRFGYVPAFVFAVENLDLMPRYNSSFLPQVLMLAPASVQKKEVLQKWIKDNADKIIYNNEKKQFDVKK